LSSVGSTPRGGESPCSSGPHSVSHLEAVCEARSAARPTDSIRPTPGLVVHSGSLLGCLPKDDRNLPVSRRTPPFKVWVPLQDARGLLYSGSNPGRPPPALIIHSVGGLTGTSPRDVPQAYWTRHFRGFAPPPTRRGARRRSCLPTSPALPTSGCPSGTDPCGGIGAHHNPRHLMRRTGLCACGQDALRTVVPARGEPARRSRAPGRRARGLHGGRLGIRNRSWRSSRLAGTSGEQELPYNPIIAR